MTVAPEKDFVAIGQLAAHLQQSVRAIEEAVSVLGLTPAMRLNGVLHFDAGQVELIRQFLGQSSDR